MFSPSFLRQLKNADFYRQVPKDLTQGTLSGASVSVLGALFMVLLLVLELRSWWTVKLTQEVVLDHSRDPFFRVNFNVTLSNVKCRFAQIDLEDDMGTVRHDIVKHINKHRVSASNLKLGSGDIDNKEQHPEVEEGVQHPGVDHSIELDTRGFEAGVKETPVTMVNFFAPWCMWCQKFEPVWEAAAKEIHAKHTYTVRLGKVNCVANEPLCIKKQIHAYPTVLVFRGTPEAHHDYHGPRTVAKLLEFAAEEEKSKEGQAALKKKPDTHQARSAVKVKGHEGCNMWGYIRVHRVPGRITFSAHSRTHSFEHKRMNSTHAIHALSFGGHSAKESIGALSQRSFVSRHRNTTHEHFIKVLGYEKHTLSGRRHHDYRYTATHGAHLYHVKHARDHKDYKSTVVRWSYDVSPLMLVEHETHTPFFHLITNVCALLGGTFVVFGFIAAFANQGIEMIKRRKQGLGKQG